MAFKDWKPTKYRSDSFTMFMNTLQEYSNFEDNYYLTFGDNGEEIWLSVTKEGKQILVKKFNHLKDARAFANKYMKNN